jgi:hypothetical protein
MSPFFCLKFDNPGTLSRVTKPLVNMNNCSSNLLLVFSVDTAIARYIGVIPSGHC